MKKIKCGICKKFNCRIYRPYGNFYRPKDNRCNGCLTDRERYWYVPCEQDVDGSIWGYTTIPQYEIERFNNLPEASRTRPYWNEILNGWSDNETVIEMIKFYTKKYGTNYISKLKELQANDLANYKNYVINNYVRGIFQEFIIER